MEKTPDSHSLTILGRNVATLILLKTQQVLCTTGMIICVALLLGLENANAVDSGDTKLARRAMNLLRDNCISCHNSEKTKGELDFTSDKNARNGGSEGPAFIDGDPDSSRMIQFIKPDSETHMPPKKQLSAEEIDILSQWISAGALWIPDELIVKDNIVAVAELGNLPDDYHPVFAVALSPNDKQLAAGYGNQVGIYNLSGKAPMIKLKGHRDVVQSIVWSPDGKLLATGGFRKVILWKTGDWVSAGEVGKLPGRVTALAYSKNGEGLISASNAPGQRAKISIWNVNDLSERLGWWAHSGTIYDITLSPDGKTLATTGEDKLIRFWNLDNGKRIKQIEAHSAPVMSLAFKPDGTAIASGAADKELKIWDVKTREQKNLVTGHPGNVASIVWPDNKAGLITASDDGALRLCSESSKSPVKTWAKAADLVHSLDVTTDGKKFFGGSENGQVYEWDRSGKIIRTLVYGK